jgi:membrane associated rhomboid family serine protease
MASAATHVGLAPDFAWPAGLCPGPNSTVRGLIVIFPVQLSAWFFLGAWFLYQLVEANFGIFGSAANGGGVAFFAHVGGFIFGVVVTLLLTRANWIAPQDRSAAVGVPA